MTPLFTKKGKCEVDLNNEKKRINQQLLWNIPLLFGFDSTHFIYNTLVRNFLMR